MINSIEQIADELLRNGLLDDASLGESCHALEKRGDAITAPNLLSLLTAEGKLTPFQAEEVGQGRANQLVLGNYLVLSRIGEGGMGTVFKALHRRMQRVVALKVIRKEVATREFITRFRREIQLLARLNHPHVVIAYDADQCPLGDFLVMEYVEGTDLGEVLRRTCSLSIAEAITAVRQAASALGYAHQQGIVHRDIKPANLLRDVSGCIKVVDLGLARVAEWEGAKGSELTQAGAVAGTVDYMSPEQAEDPQAVDLRSDIYSLGCTLFSLLTGGPVFSKSSLIGRILAHRTEPPPNLTFVRNDVPPALDAIFQRMVAKSPDDRFSTMEEVAAALDALHRPPSDCEATQVFTTAVVEGRSPVSTTALVVEESRLQANMIGKVLTEIGMSDIQVCQSGADCLQLLKSYSPGVLLSSMRLPDMSGLELAARIRDSLRWLKMGIVLMSGDEWTSQRRAAAQRLSRLQLLKKPFDARSLRKAIDLAAADNARDEQPLNGLGDLRVLIVDDSRAARRNVQVTLSELGFSRFTEADDGDVAVEKMRQVPFDLVVTDYHMPRMDGRQLVSHIRERSSHRTVPIIMVTTEFDPQVLAPIYQLGVSAICNKSFERGLVRNIVMQLFA
ncbi:MAG: response regulator [Pirellulales bacterium]